jgi:transcriptional antiterminator RfaH
MNRWYVLMTKPHKESLVCGQLAQRGFDVYLPLLPRRVTAGARAVRPLFPRYLFARGTDGDISIEAIQWTPGLTCVVRLGDEYARLQNEVVEHIRLRLAQANGELSVPFRVGERVRLPADHPLSMLEAVFERPLSDGARAHVLVQVMGRLTRCEVNVADLARWEETPLRLPPMIDTPRRSIR